ncbi:3-phosphoglycerate dehydrogenase [Bordetella petrii]|nr:3-phosphoglycerate dehydrogenase [Bordetella petrii]
MHVFMAGRLPQAAFDRLERENMTMTVIDAPNAQTMAEGLIGADILLLRATPVLTAEHIRAASRLKVVSRYGVGYDNVDLPALTSAGIPLMVVGNTNSTSVAEGAFSLLLAAARHTLAYDQAVRLGNWKIRDSFAATEVSGKRLLIIGFGRIGRKMAQLAQGFDMQVAIYDPHVSAQDVLTAGFESEADLDHALARADFISLHLGLSSSTSGMLNAARLSHLKSNAIIVNTSRGGLIDEHALAMALNSGAIRAAGIDVFAMEPVNDKHVLFNTPNVVLSPHAAGLTREAADRMAVATVENALAAVMGTANRSLVVNPEVLNVKF